MPEWITEPRVEHTGYVVAPERCAEAYDLHDVRPVADGWAVGLWQRAEPLPPILRWYERGIDVVAVSFARVKHADLRAFRGYGVYFWAAAGAPDAALAAAVRAIGGSERLRAAWLRLRAMTGG